MYFFVLLESLLLVMLVYLLFLIISYKKIYDSEMLSPYECGFDPNSITRLVFSYRFFLISILFIIFDVEISLMIPIPYLFLNWLGMVIFFFFMFILSLGLMYEYYYGSLDWLMYCDDKM